MNTSRLLLVLGAAGAIAAAAGCDSKTKCVADCETLGLDSDGDSTGDAESGSEASTGTPVCEAAQENAFAFVESNRQCATHADCKLVAGICYQGVEAECGSVALAVTADDAQWDALHEALMACECGANPCGATAVCTEEGICDAQFGTMEAQCVIAEEAVELFLAENRACEVDEDCQYVDKGCYDGPLAECVAISLNVDADLEVWSELEQALGPCGHECGGNDCGASVRCGADGLCEATF